MEKQNCPLIQTYQLLIDEIPIELQNLEYGVYPDNTNYNNVSESISKSDTFVHNESNLSSCLVFL